MRTAETHRYNPGDTVSIFGMDFVVLDTDSKTMLLLKKKHIRRCKFGADNDYCHSYPSKAINAWLKDLYDLGLNKDHVQPRYFGDAFADAGPLRVWEAVKYKKYLPESDYPWWLIGNEWEIYTEELCHCVDTKGNIRKLPCTNIANVRPAMIVSFDVLRDDEQLLRMVPTRLLMRELATRVRR